MSSDPRSRGARPKRALVLGAALTVATVSLAGGAVSAQDVKDVARNRTLILTPWGDQPAQLANVDNWNPYLPTVTHQRDAMQFTVNEALFYTNLNTGELIPWQAESYEYNDDFTSATIHLRDGVTWSDGQPMTADDVKFTLEAVRDAAPDLNNSTNFQEWIKEVEVVDPQTAVIHFNKPAPRWVRDNLALGHENHYPIL